MENLTDKKCVPCEGSVPPLSRGAIEKYQARLKEPWEVAEGGKKIRREFDFKNFKEALIFVNQAADIAEEEGHHPDLHIFYNRVLVELSTHSIKGLSENDFILAAKIEKI